MGYLDETGLSRVWNRIKAYIQSLNYTSNIGTVTGITMNNTSYSPVNGDVDIGTVVTDVSNKADDTDVVHIEGAEDITGVKTFVGNKTLKFKQSSNSDKIGFTCYNKSDVEFGNFEVLPLDRAINLGIYSVNSTPANDFLVGFKVQAKDSTGVLHKFGLRAPSRLGDSTYAEHYIPVIINNKEADNTGSITLSASDIGALSDLTTIPTKVSDLTNDSGFITSYTETDPVFSASAAASITSADITAWNGKSTFSGSYNDLTDKPTIPTVPTNVSAFTNDAGYITGYTETDPTVPSWAKASTKPSYTASEVGALPDTTSIPTESTVSGWGFTKNAGTITGVTMNGASKGTSGVVDLGTVITSHQDISGKENTSNKVTSLSSSSTDTQYPSAKCVYDLVGDIETLLAAI